MGLFWESVDTWFATCFGDALGVCVSDVLGMFWQPFGNVLVLFWAWFWEWFDNHLDNFLGLRWGCFGDFKDVPVIVLLWMLWDDLGKLVSGSFGDDLEMFTASVKFFAAVTLEIFCIEPFTASLSCSPASLACHTQATQHCLAYRRMHQLNRSLE